MRWWCLVLIPACASTPSTPPSAHVSTSFVVTALGGNGPSPLDPLLNQTIAFDVMFDSFEPVRGDETDTPDCKTTLITQLDPTRTATGPTADLVQPQVLDMLRYWDLRYQMCTNAALSSITLHAEIDILNLAFGCSGIPASAMIRNPDGFPQITSFTAMHCNSTLLDVVNNRIVENPDFSMIIETTPAEIP